jgi:hypothetical protein
VRKIFSLGSPEIEMVVLHVGHWTSCVVIRGVLLCVLLVISVSYLGLLAVFIGGGFLLEEIILFCRHMKSVDTYS